MDPISPRPGDLDQSDMAAWLRHFAEQRRAEEERELAQAMAAVFAAFPTTTAAIDEGSQG